MATPLILGIDLGTTACKVLAADSAGVGAASASATVPTHKPEPGAAEQDVEEIWLIAARCCHEVMTNVEARRIAGVALSGAMHSLVLNGEDGRPLGRATTWADLRPVEAAEDLRRRTDPHAMYLRTGCPLRWLYHPARLSRLHLAPTMRIAAIKDCVLHRLTGRWCTDLSVASATGLLDTRRFAWDSEALALAGVSAGQLPDLVSPDEIVGRVSAQASRDTGLPEGVPVIAGASDGAMANLGAVGLDPRKVVLTVGTSGAIRTIVDCPRFDDAERTWCYIALRDRWLIGGAINNGGLAIDWVRERFYPGLDREAGVEQLMRDADGVPIGAAGVTLPPYLTGERNPHWAPDLRAAIHGLTLNHTRAQVARAALEGVAFCLADVWDALPADVRDAPAVHLTGGITQSPAWCQIVADVLGVTLLADEGGDASVLGAARLGHFVLGHVASLTPPDSSNARVFKPAPKARDEYRLARDRFGRLASLTARRGTSADAGSRA